MNYLDTMLGKTVKLEISGNIERVGVLIDFGQDVVVIYDGLNYVYIPSVHLQNIRLVSNVSVISGSAFERTDVENDLSYRKILNESKGMFVKIYVAGNQAIHGYITNVLTDYFVFFSPVHKTLWIPLFHLKWLIPYPENQTPYTLSKDAFPVTPSTLKMARTFEEQLKKMEGKMVVFDLGSNPEKIGLLRSIQNHMAVLITADQKPWYWNIRHIKMVNSPNL